MFIFLAIFVLFNEICNMFFYFLEMAVLLNDFNCTCNAIMFVFNKIMMLVNAVPYSFIGNVQFFVSYKILFLMIF